jgi:hypothetical protein
MNSREKGKRGERAWRDVLRANGYDARRGQQFCGSPDSPDVICDALPGIHFEVKCVERLNIEEAMDQARRDAHTKAPVLAHKRSHRPWLVTTDADTFFRAVRGDFANSIACIAPKVFGEPPKTAGETPALPNEFSAPACAVVITDKEQRDAVPPQKEKYENPS